MLIAGGSTNVTTYFAMRKTSDGTAATGLTPADFDLQYVRSGVAPVAKVDATALAATDSAHADNKVIEIDATDAPGLYRIDWPDAAFAAGVRETILSAKVATAFTEHLRVEIDGEVTAEALGTQAKADVNAEADQALTDYNGPTSAELVTEIDSVQTDIAALNDVSTADVNAQCDLALSDYNGPTSAELVTEIDSVQTDIAAVKTETALIVADTNELQGDDIPGLISALNNVTVGAVADQVWNEAQADHVAAGSFGIIASEIASIPTTAMRGTDNAGTATNLATVDTVVDAIKAITDQFVFTKANEVDANAKSINDAEVVGDGNATPWDGV